MMPPSRRLDIQTKDLDISRTTERPDTLIPYTLVRTGLLMSPDPAEPYEQEGVLNPATAWDAAGNLYLYPRLVSKGNWSRVGKARVIVEDGVPVGVVREQPALEPDRTWEHGSHHGGTEDPRITFVPSLGLNVMTYVAFGPTGPRPAIAVSEGVDGWRRLGPIQFGFDDALDLDLNLFPNKDVVFFPEVVPDPEGRPSYALLHRPMWDLSFSRPAETVTLPYAISDDRPSIWISYVDAQAVEQDTSLLTRPSQHRPVASPLYPWEHLKIGAGPAPIRTPEGWLVIHHGVSGEIIGGAFRPQQNVSYQVGAILLDPSNPSRVLARTPEPLLSPTTDHEQSGTVANVVFPTAIERIGDRDFVFYGMADARIGVAELIRDPSRAGTPRRG